MNYARARRSAEWLVVESEEDESTLPLGSAVTETKNALRPLTLPATTGADHVNPRSVDFVTRTTPCPVVADVLVYTLPAMYSVPSEATVNEGKIRPAERKLDPGSGLIRLSGTVATVMF